MKKLKIINVNKKILNLKILKKKKKKIKIKKKINFKKKNQVIQSLKKNYKDSFNKKKIK